MSEIKSDHVKILALSCEKDDLKKQHSHYLLKFDWYEDNY